MTASNFVSYQKFFRKEDAQELAELLSSHGLELRQEDSTGRFDPSFANNPIHVEYRVLLQQKDFERADAILLEQSEPFVDEVDKDYYLLAFSNEELYEVVAKRDEWSKFDFLLAQKLLADRGLDVNQNVLENLKRERMEQLAQPDKNQEVWVIIGYITAILGGLFGVFIGWHLFTFKKTLPNGERVYNYSQQDRKHGQIIFVIGLISVLTWFIVKFFIVDFQYF